MTIRPRTFEMLCQRTRLWLFTGALAMLVAGLYSALVSSPPDYQQGQMVRIMYIHVPCAWMALLIYCAMALASLSIIIWRNPVYGVFLRAAAPVGMVFSLVTLITGSIWGQPVWGIWWVWDARLTSMLILFLTYIGLMLLMDSFEQPERGESATALLCLLGSVNVVVVKYSVEWFNTLHQPASLMRATGPAIDTSMLWPLMLMFLGLLLLGLAVGGLRAEAIFLTRRTERLRHRIAAQ